MIKPKFDHLFEQDMRDRLIYIRQHRNEYNLEKVIFNECIMYASDICIEFQQQSGGFITFDWISHIVNETNKVIDRYFSGSLNEESLYEISKKIEKELCNPMILQKRVDEYYGRI